MVELLSTPILVTIILGVVGLVIPLLDTFRRERGVDRNKIYSAIAFGALAVAIGIVVFRVFNGEVLPAVAFSKEVLVDDLFGSFFAIALLIVSIMVTASSWNYYKGKSNPAAYYSLILLSTIGMVIIAYSTDFVMLFVAWELMSLPTYALAGFTKRDPISNEAAIKYFMFGALSSALIVFAMGLVYGLTGTTNIGDSIKALAALDASLTPVALFAVALFVAGFGFKMGLVPFHMWLPDAYEGAPTTIAALLAAGTKKAGFAAALRVIVLGMFALNLDWTLT
ncbi:MAG: NADH-quinone oxidoreductase subunit N, partial [Nitrososphaera sp.]